MNRFCVQKNVTIVFFKLLLLVIRKLYALSPVFKGIPYICSRALHGRVD